MKHDFMSHDLHLPELTLRGMLLGALITVIFTASNVYLGLKVGLTFLVIPFRQPLFQWQFYVSSRILTFLKTTWYKHRLPQLVLCPQLSLSCQVYLCLAIGMVSRSGKHSCSAHAVVPLVCYSPFHCVVLW